MKSKVAILASALAIFHSQVSAENRTVTISRDKITVHLEQINATQKSYILKKAIDSLIGDPEKDCLKIIALRFQIEVSKTKFQDIFSVSFVPRAKKPSKKPTKKPVAAAKEVEAGRTFLTRSKTLLGLVEDQIDEYSRSHSWDSVIDQTSSESRLKPFLFGLAAATACCIGLIMIKKMGPKALNN